MPTRRHLLSGLAAAPTMLPSLAKAAVPAQLALTPSCGDDHDLTPRQTEGPYFTRSSPEKRDFSADSASGEKMTIGGYVLAADCRPIAGALIELWHADERGIYDNSGYRLRGHQFADAEGRWWFDTIVPGLYPGRTRHFHLKVQRPGGEVLTTQLYFPGEPGNSGDRIFNEALLLDMTAGSGGKFGRYNFIAP
jgi:protocatechuate 3,4-dioxygenase beta subunit